MARLRSVVSNDHRVRLSARKPDLPERVGRSVSNHEPSEGSACWRRWPRPRIAAVGGEPSFKRRRSVLQRGLEPSISAAASLGLLPRSRRCRTDRSAASSPSFRRGRLGQDAPFQNAKPGKPMIADADRHLALHRSGTAEHRCTWSFANTASTGDFLQSRTAGLALRPDRAESSHSAGVETGHPTCSVMCSHPRSR